jgi:hypothetical protein
MTRIVKTFKLRQMILVSLLFGALAGAFNSTGSFTQTALAAYPCPDQIFGDTRCVAIYCYKCYACNTGTCQYMRVQGTGTCSPGGTCTPGQ